MTADRPSGDERRAADPRRPPVDLSAQASAAQRIADRSRSEGAWSLGHLRLCWIALVLGGAVLGVVAGVVDGAGAVTGVVLGTAIVGAFFTFSAVVIAWVGKTNPKTVMVAALFAYVIKVMVLALILLTMPIDGFVNVRWMAGAIGLGLFLWLGAHMRYVWTLKLYYVDPG
jgi:ATP synthase protein I